MMITKFFVLFVIFSLSLALHLQDKQNACSNAIMACGTLCGTDLSSDCKKSCITNYAKVICRGDDPPNISAKALLSKFISL